MTWGWWLALLIGALSIVAGIIVILKPSNSLSTLAVIVGIFILIDGILEIAGAILGDTESRGLLAVIGTLSVIAGVLLIRHPLGGVRAVALLLGIWLIAAGVVRLISAFAFPGDRIWRIIVALVLGNLRDRDRVGAPHRVRDVGIDHGHLLHLLRPRDARGGMGHAHDPTARRRDRSRRQHADLTAPSTRRS